MTTVVNPSSSPVPVFNRSGTSIVSLAAGLVAGSNPIGNEAVSIPRVSGITVVLVTTDLSVSAQHSAVSLPSAADGAEIGDVVEVYLSSTTSNPQQVDLFPAVGESIGLLPSSTGTNSDCRVGIQPEQGRIFRKVSSTNWQPVG